MKYLLAIAFAFQVTVITYADVNINSAKKSIISYTDVNQKYLVKKFIVEKKTVINRDKNYAHPKKLNEKQCYRILYALKLRRPPIKLFDSYELLKLAPILQKEFKTLKSTETLLLTRITENSKNKTKQIDRFSFAFVNPSFLHIKYSYSGYNSVRQLQQGNNVYTPFKNNRAYFRELLINSRLWNEDINKPIFKNESMKRINPKAIEEQLKSKENTKKETVTAEELASKLEQLDKMLEENKIDKEQYEILKNNIMKKSGVK
jgi:hypothetical protein